MTDRFQPVSTRTIDLALALNPIDALTETPLREAATVSVEGLPTKPELNPSGYWLYLDPPVSFDQPTVSVTVDPPPEYAERTLDVDTTADPPARRIEMYPSTAYPFPAGSTLIEGTVTDGVGDAVAGATVTLDETDLETRTDTDGSFILRVAGIRTTESAGPNDVLRVDPDSANPKRVRVYLPGDSPEQPTIVADHPDHSQAPRDLVITEGEYHLLDSPLVV